MGGRTEAGRARKQERKLQNTHTTVPGPSVRERLMADLDGAMIRYLEAREKWGVEEISVREAWGEVKGLARAVGRFGVLTYFPNRATREAIRESQARVKEMR